MVYMFPVFCMLPFKLQEESQTIDLLSIQIDEYESYRCLRKTKRLFLLNMKNMGHGTLSLYELVNLYLCRQFCRIGPSEWQILNGVHNPLTNNLLKSVR